MTGMCDLTEIVSKFIGRKEISTTYLAVILSKPLVVILSEAKNPLKTLTGFFNRRLKLTSSE